MIQNQLFTGDNLAEFAEELELLEKEVPTNILEIIRNQQIRLLIVPKIEPERIHLNTPAHSSVNANQIHICEPIRLQKNFGFSLAERVAIFLHEIGHILNNPLPELTNRNNTEIESLEMLKVVMMENLIKKKPLKEEIDISSECYADYFVVISNFKIPLLNSFEKYLKNVESSDANLFALRRKELISNNVLLTNELQDKLNNN